MRSDNPFRPNHHVATQTSWQGAVVRFDDFVTGATFELGERGFEALLDVMCTRIAREYIKILERDELRRRRSA